MYAPGEPQVGSVREWLVESRGGWSGPRSNQRSGARGVPPRCTGHCHRPLAQVLQPSVLWGSPAPWSQGGVPAASCTKSWKITCRESEASGEVNPTPPTEVAPEGCQVRPVYFTSVQSGVGGPGLLPSLEGLAEPRATTRPDHCKLLIELVPRRPPRQGMPSSLRPSATRFCPCSPQSDRCNSLSRCEGSTRARVPGPGPHLGWIPGSSVSRARARHRGPGCRGARDCTPPQSLPGPCRSLKDGPQVTEERSRAGQ